ncbi:Uncharacterised protein [Myroides odoratus]|uniref:Uncharacterized protein n=1 Tax=Myroides odoratus TaxID=256 RepID=A0A378RKQ4_MYROD|nr:Uncharacterised protein [Myroides odoratus]
MNFFLQINEKEIWREVIMNKVKFDNPHNQLFLVVRANYNNTK